MSEHPDKVAQKYSIKAQIKTNKIIYIIYSCTAILEKNMLRQSNHAEPPPPSSTTMSNMKLGEDRRQEIGRKGISPGDDDR